MSTREYQTQRSTSGNREPSMAQVHYLEKLLTERRPPDWPADAATRLETLGRMIHDGKLTRRGASSLIDVLRTMPLDPDGPTATDRAARSLDGARPTGATATFDAARVGVYSLDDELYVVRPNRAKTSIYAMKLVTLDGSARRVTGIGEVVDFDYAYAPSVVHQLTGEHRLTVDDVEALSIRYGRCVMCGRTLKAAASVQRGIGPVCRQKVS